MSSTLQDPQIIRCLPGQLCSKLQVLSLVSLALLGLSATVYAQVGLPGAQSPFGNLSCAAVAAGSTGMYTAVAKAEQSLRELIQKLMKDETISSKDMARLYQLNAQFSRWVAYVEKYREPAAVDWQFRSAFYTQKLLEIRGRYYGMPHAARDRQKALLVLQRGQPARAKAYEKTATLFCAGDFKQAENSIEKIMSEIWSVSGVLQDVDKKPFYDPMYEVYGPIQVAMLQSRARDSEQALQQEKDKLNTAASELEQLLQSNEGAKGLTEIAAKWKALHLQRLKVYVFSRGSSLGSDEPVMSARQSNAEAELVGDPEKIKSAILQYVARHIAVADAQQAVELHQQFRKQLADLVLATGDIPWQLALEEAMTALANKAGMSSDVFSYDMATHELLRWRERTASEWAAAKNLETASQIARRLLASSPQKAGMYELNQETPLPKLLKAIPELIPEINQQLLGKVVRIPAVYPLSQESEILWCSYADDGFRFQVADGQLARKNCSERLVSLLSKDLLCNSENEPLTLAATCALQSAKMGCCVQISGKITDYSVDGYLSELTNLNSEQVNIYPLGEIGPAIPGDAKRALMLNCQVEPLWYQHRYYIVSRP